MAHSGRGLTHSRNVGATGVRNTGSQRPKFVSLGEAARVIGYQLKTLHNWISAGILRREHGLLKVRGRWRVNLATFLEAFEKGELG
jgi:hypothetical protein